MLENAGSDRGGWRVREIGHTTVRVPGHLGLAGVSRSVQRFHKPAAEVPPHAQPGPGSAAGTGDQLRLAVEINVSRDERMNRAT